MAVERTFAMFKPGVLQRRIVGELISRMEKKGFNIVAIKLMRIPMEMAKIHYEEHREKSFFESLTNYIVSGPVIAMVLQRENAITTLRKICGATNPENAEMGTIRGDYAVSTERNIIHASDSPESAKREIGLFFKEEEIFPFEDGNEHWL